MSVSQRGGRGGRGQPAVERIVHLHKRDYADGLVHLARQAGAVDPEMLGNQLVVCPAINC